MTFAGKIYFVGSGGSLIRCYDTGTRVQTVVTPKDTRLYDGSYWPRFGAMTVHPDGTVMNQGWYGEIEPGEPSYGEQYMTAKIFSADLKDILGTKNFHYQQTSPIGTPNDDATLDTIIWDDTAQVFWTRHSLVADDSGLWALSSLNTNLDLIGHKGDCIPLAPFGDGYSGADSCGANSDLLGRWLYHNLTYADGIGRLNVDTGAWHAITNSNSDHNGTACKLLGVDEQNGHYITLNLTQSYSVDYVGHMYWVQIRNPNGSDPWWDLAGGHIPSGWANNIGAPLVEYTLDLPEIGWQNGPYLDDYDPNPVTIMNGRMYFLVDKTWDVDYGDNSDGTGWGYDTEMWSMDLSNGSVQLEAQIPYGYFNSAGEPTTYNDPDYWNTNGGTYGLALAPIELNITGQAGPTRVRPYGEAG